MTFGTLYRGGRPPGVVLKLAECEINFTLTETSLTSMVGQMFCGLP